MGSILVVEDDEVIRLLLVEILQHAGYSVLEAENGQAGWELIQHHSPDLIITDIFMPVMDGIDLLAAILRHAPDSKIIAITGGHKAMHPEMILKMAQTFGAIDIISKPFQISALIQKVELALQSTVHTA